MENQNKSVVYIYSSWAVLNLNIIFPFYFLLFWLFLFSSSNYKFATLFHSTYIFPIQKKALSLSLSLTKFFPFFVGFIIIIMFISFLP